MDRKLVHPKGSWLPISGSSCYPLLCSGYPEYSVCSGAYSSGSEFWAGFNEAVHLCPSRHRLGHSNSENQDENRVCGWQGGHSFSSSSFPSSIAEVFPGVGSSRQAQVCGARLPQWPPHRTGRVEC